MAVVNQVWELINLVSTQTFGKAPITVVDTRSMIAMGDYLRGTTKDKRDVWTGNLYDRIGKTILVARDLKLDNFGISRDEHEFGALTRKLRTKELQVKKNEEYDVDADSSANYDPFKITPPVVSEQLFGKHGTFECDIVILDNQLFTAFTSESEMLAFYDWIYQKLDRAISIAKASYDRTAICNFIGEKINLQTKQPTKIHAVNLLDKYNKEMGKQLKYAGAKHDPDFLRYCSAQFKLYKNHMEQFSSQFSSSDDFPSQTYGDYFRFYLLNEFNTNMEMFLYSDTFHNEFEKVEGFKIVDYWQGIGNTTPFSFEDCSKINVKLASDSTGGTTIDQGGIIGLMMDKDAVATFYNREQSESWRIPKKGVKHWRAVTEMMANDLIENGCVFYMADVEAA